MTDTPKRTDGTSTITIDQETTGGTTPDIATSSTSLAGGGSGSGALGTSTTSQGSSTSSRTTPSFISTSSGTTWTTTTQQQHHPETTASEEHEQYTYSHTPTIPELEHTSVAETEEPTVPDPEPPFPYPQPPLAQPPPYPPQPRPPKGNNKGRISSEAEERTAMIIGIVAGALIAVILVILLLLWLKSTGDRTYKNEHDKSGAYGGQGPNAALLGSNTGTNNSQLHHHHHQQTNGATVPLNGSLRNGGSDKGAQMNVAGGMGGNGASMGAGSLQLQKPKKRDSKDIKEWYV